MSHCCIDSTKETTHSFEEDCSRCEKLKYVLTLGRTLSFSVLETVSPKKTFSALEKAVTSYFEALPLT